MIFKRKLYDKMLEWKQQWKGQYALLIKGARRVGKSTLVEEFAKHERGGSFALSLRIVKDFGISTPTHCQIVET